MVAMEASDDMDAVGHAERIGQVSQLAVGDAALDAVAVILQHAHEARVFPFDMRRQVHGHLDVPAAPEKGAQRRVGFAATQRKYREVGIEQHQAGIGPADAIEKVSA